MITGLTLILLMSGKYTEYIVGIWGGTLPGVSVGLGRVSGAGNNKVVCRGSTSAASMEVPLLKASSNL